MSGKVVATNKKAYHDYFIDTIYECGMVLKGPEVKSMRGGKVQLKDGYAKIKEGEVFLYNVHVSPYSHTTYDLLDPERVRKLLLSRQEIRKMIGKVQVKGFALVPLKIYFKGNGKAKLELGLCRGKKLHDKRETLKKKEGNRDVERALRRD
ncbi:MAG: SsrA-binding protein SmpB [Desulfobulbaceae bacterium]|nr:SsrA-binding protein SmpB [Desulfobulbaceae bacterium]